MNRALCFLMFTLLAVAARADQPEPQPARTLWVLQANDPDPTAPSSQPTGRWYHWLGCDPAVTHLETAIAVDAGAFAGRGQRIRIAGGAPLAAVQVKIKRIGDPGPLVWQAGTARDGSDLGSGQVTAGQVSVNYEHFVTLPLSAGSPADGNGPPEVYLRLRAASGRCPDDYYAVYCTWQENDPRKVQINTYTGVAEIGMMYRALRADPHGAALEPDGRPIVQGASMMYRVLCAEPGPGRRALLAGEEEPYGFVEALTAGRDPRREGLPWPDARAEPGEIVIGPQWQIQVAAAHSPQVDQAVADLESFFRTSMQLGLPVRWDRSAEAQPGRITIGQRRDLPDGPRRSAGYRFTAGDGGVQLQGYDPQGVLRAVWYLEDLMMLRGAAYLKPDARTREPRYAPRATCAAWGGTGELCTPAPVYTDAHLALISHYGYDAIWLVWNPGPERGASLPTAIAPGRVPEGTTYQPFLPRLRSLTERAARYGLEIVILYAAPHPGDEGRRQALREEAQQLVRDVPKIRSIVLLDEGMGSTRKGTDAWADTCTLLARAVREVRPEVRVAAWRYTFAARTADRGDWDRGMEHICRMDRAIGYMANFDSYWMRRRDGRVQRAFDYCLSLKSPSDDFQHAAQFLLQEAQRNGQPCRPLWTKIESRFSQESNTQPEIPCMQRWVERFDAVNRFQDPPLSGLIANWYHQGFFPTPVTELFGWLSYTNPPPAEELLRGLARRDFGPGQEDRVVAAWADFSEAIWHFPFYFGLSYPMNAGYAQPFWLDAKAVNPRPWRRGFVNSLEAMELAEAVTPRSDGNENRVRLRGFQTLWEAGLAKLRAAAGAAPAAVRSRAEANARNAQSLCDKGAMTLRLVQWLDARARLDHARTTAEKQAALDALERVGRQELAAARAALPMYLCDSRLGHLNHGRGCFTAMSILDKIDALQKTLSVELPACREKLQGTRP